MNINRFQHKLLCQNVGSELVRLEKLTIIQIIEETKTLTCMGSKKKVKLVGKEIEKIFCDTRYLMFPVEASGLLFGNIERIRMKTQVKMIHIFQAETEGSERKVGVAGTEAQMEAACGLIKELVNRGC